MWTMLLVLFDITNLAYEFHLLMIWTKSVVLYDETNLAYELFYAGNPIIRKLDMCTMLYKYYILLITKLI